MSFFTNTLTLAITVGTIYEDSYAMDVNYTLITGTDTAYTVTQYVSIPYTNNTSSVLLNGVTQTVTVVTFITGTELTTYLSTQAPITALTRTASAADQFIYLATYTGTSTVVLQ
jgi:hypothetical protein